jgi:putative membrane protein
MKLERITKALVALGAIALLLPAIGWAQAYNGTKLSSSDQKFIKEAAEGDMAEVQLGKLAEQKAADNTVKQFAQRMVTDHSQNKRKIEDLAAAQGMNMHESLNAKDKATYDVLQGLSGEQFDTAYMNQMVKDHTHDVNKFKQEESKTKDPVVKDYVKSTLPTLESHLKEAQQIAPKENKEAANQKSQ